VILAVLNETDIYSKMATKVVIAALLLCTVLQIAEGVCKTSGLTAEEQAVLDAHNAQRAKHADTDPLCYGVTGEDITFTSQAWSDTQAGKKGIEHSTGGKYGENLAMAGRAPAAALAKSPAYVASVDAWYKEIDYWDYATNAKKADASGKMTGHFTQVVWKGSKQVNCGYATYVDSMNYYVVTCQYFPPGNYQGQYAANVAPLKSTKKTCNKPTVANAALKPNTATVQEGEKYTVTCSDGHILEGVVNFFTCGSDGNLTPASITCKAVETVACKKPAVENAALAPTTATVKAGEKYTVTCNEGYKLKGDVNTFTCGSDGKVTPASITCDKESSAGRIALSALLMAAVAALLH